MDDTLDSINAATFASVMPQGYNDYFDLFYAVESGTYWCIKCKRPIQRIAHWYECECPPEPIRSPFSYNEK